MQQIPSHDKLIRMMFKPTVKEHVVGYSENKYIVPYTDDVEIAPNKWKSVKNLSIGEKLLTSDNTYDTVLDIQVIGDNYILIV